MTGPPTAAALLSRLTRTWAVSPASGAMAIHRELFPRRIHRVYGDAMSTSMTLLSVLERGPAHGYTLKQEYDRQPGERRPLAFGQVYASLSRFERDGWAEVADVESGAGPERKRFRITPDGVEQLDEWVYTPQQADLGVTSTLFNRLAVALLSGRSAERVLDAQREVHRARMRELQQARRRATGGDLLAITYELTHLDADLRWIDDSRQRLDDLRAALTSGSSS